MDSKQLACLVEPIITWFAQNGRQDMPWRQDPTPYHVWVSEIMLQQTRIEAVIPYYLNFIQKLPTIEDLANADDETLLKLWQGLGYYSRVRNLKKTAVIAVEQYGGLPRNYGQLLALPGIGEYTAGAISSIAFGLGECAVDGNVLRVLARYLCDDSDVLLPATKQKAQTALRAIYPTGNDARLLTEGLMELGEVVCLPNGKPRCEACPLQATCLSYRQGKQEVLPVRNVKMKKTQEDWTVFVLSAQNQYALQKRPDKGLLAGLWQFPMAKGRLGISEVQALYPNATITPLGDAEHIFTHKRWSMVGYKVSLPQVLPPYEWYTAEQVATQLAVPSAFKVYLEQIK